MRIGLLALLVAVVVAVWGSNARSIDKGSSEKTVAVSTNVADAAPGAAERSTK